MSDFIRELDPAYRAFLVIFLSVMLKGIISARWDRYKQRQAKLPTPMKMRKGIYVPWGPVQRIERAGTVVLYIWLAWMALLLCLLAYMKIMGLPRLF